MTKIRKRKFFLPRSDTKMLAVSVIGPSHVRRGTPNQDACVVATIGDWRVAVVSDGVGSCPHSHVGSRLLCTVIGRILRETPPTRFEPEAFLEKVRNEWVDGLRPLTYREASATCLMALSDSRHFFAAMLGDGCIGIQMRGGSVRLMTEDKTSGFSNMTDSMTDRTKPGDWRCLLIPQKAVVGVMLATDGVADDLLRPEDFVREILTSVQKTETLRAKAELTRMLTDWPVPGHSDDKTLACMIFP